MSVVNNVLVDPIRQPGFDLSSCSWSLVTVSWQAKTAALQTYANVRPLYVQPSADHDALLSTRLLTKIEGSPQSLHEAYAEAVHWLENVATTAFAKLKYSDIAMRIRRLYNYYSLEWTIHKKRKVWCTVYND